MASTEFASAALSAHHRMATMLLPRSCRIFLTRALDGLLALLAISFSFVLDGFDGVTHDAFDESRRCSGAHVRGQGQ
jgi:hypothetical protein